MSDNIDKEKNQEILYTLKNHGKITPCYIWMSIWIIIYILSYIIISMYLGYILINFEVSTLESKFWFFIFFILWIFMPIRLFDLFRGFYLFDRVDFYDDKLIFHYLNLPSRTLKYIHIKDVLIYFYFPQGMLPSLLRFYTHKFTFNIFCIFHERVGIGKGNIFDEDKVLDGLKDFLNKMNIKTKE
jgi:hypothetical protein